MQKRKNRFEIIGEMLACLDDLYIWEFDSSMNLVSTNHPGHEVFLGMLEISDIKERAMDFFSREDNPTILCDSVGFAWAVACLKEQGEMRSFFFLGPAFTSSLPEQNLIRKMEEIHIPLSIRRELLASLNSIPVIHPTPFSRYAIMLHYCLTGERILAQDVGMDTHLAKEPQEPAGRIEKQVFHGTWNYEQQMLKAIQTGDISYLHRSREFPTGASIGTLCPGDPLRQAKDELIVLVTLCSRAAIMGGLSSELSYTLSDYYVQNAEGAKTIGQVYAVSGEVLTDYINRVHKARQNADYSQLTLSCMDYVLQHITEKIQVSDIAYAIGYADYYLTAKFKKDTGINLRDYICQQKVEQAKLLLRTTKLSVQDIANELSFSSTSYFCAVFRKFAGITPGEFREPANQS